MILNFYKFIVLLVTLLLTMLVSAQKGVSKPLLTYEKEGIKLNSYNYSGIEHLFHQKNDTTYVVNFWATWCLPCVEELPHFEKLNQKYKDGKFKMILVSLDFPKMAESRVIPFIKRKDLKAEVVLLNDPDANSWIEKVNKDWSGAIPATIIFRNEKRKFFEKAFTETELENEIKSLLN